jgi:2-phospho-L-lactate guanylyltransferase (CobY/MobA/RfbA family)
MSKSTKGIRITSPRAKAVKVITRPVTKAIPKSVKEIRVTSPKAVTRPITKANRFKEKLRILINDAFEQWDEKANFMVVVSDLWDEIQQEIEENE